jgi:hypothetical protein
MQGVIWKHLGYAFVPGLADTREQASRDVGIRKLRHKATPNRCACPLRLFCSRLLKEASAVSNYSKHPTAREASSCGHNGTLTSVGEAEVLTNMT